MVQFGDLASFGQPKACGQTELPDRSCLIGQKLLENAKIEKFKCDILGDFQTLLKQQRSLDIFFVIRSCNFYRLLCHG